METHCKGGYMTIDRCLIQLWIIEYPLASLINVSISLLAYDYKFALVGSSDTGHHHGSVEQNNGVQEKDDAGSRPQQSLQDIPNVLNTDSQGGDPDNYACSHSESIMAGILHSLQVICVSFCLASVAEINMTCL